MGAMQIHKTDFEGVYLIDNFFAGDKRGSFTKTYLKETFEENGIHFSLSETFASVSQKNVIRGLHFQKVGPQSKLVSVLCGEVWDVVVDLRPDSATYMKYYSANLSEDNHRGLYIPKGFAHGFASLSDNTVMLYQCEGRYDGPSDSGIRYDDPQIGVQWPVSEDVAIHSERDLKLPSFKEYLENPMQLGK